MSGDSSPYGEPPDARYPQPDLSGRMEPRSRTRLCERTPQSRRFPDDDATDNPRLLPRNDDWRFPGAAAIGKSGVAAATGAPSRQSVATTYLAANTVDAQHRNGVAKKRDLFLRR